MTADDYRRCKRAVHRALEANAAAWNASGWSVIGGGDRLRIAVHVSHRLTAPAHPVDTIRLPPSVGGGDLKLAVRAVHSHLPPRPALPLAGFSASVLQSASVQGFAPGCAVETPGGRGGVAAFVSNSDSVFALTCGHTFDGGTALEWRGTRVGTLVKNLLDDDQPMDAALCRLNTHGIDDATSSAGEGTWFGKVHSPGTDPEDEAVVYPTHVGAGLPFSETIVSFSACETIDGLRLCDLVTLSECTVEGDSGTLLAIDGKYLGICRGSTGNLSCFTPVRAAILRLRGSYPGLRIWRPT